MPNVDFPKFSVSEWNRIGIILAALSLMTFLLTCVYFHEWHVTQNENWYSNISSDQMVYGPVITSLKSNWILLQTFYALPVILFFVGYFYFLLSQTRKSLGLLSYILAIFSGVLIPNKIISWGAFFTILIYSSWYVINRRQGREILLAKITFFGTLMLIGLSFLFGMYYRDIPYTNYYFKLEDSIGTLFLISIPVTFCISIVIVIVGIMDYFKKGEKLKTSILPILWGLATLGILFFILFFIWMAPTY